VIIAKENRQHKGKNTKVSFPYLTKRLKQSKQLNRLKEHQNTFSSTRCSIYT